MSERTHKARGAGPGSSWDDASQGSEGAPHQEEEFNRGLGGPSRVSSRASSRASSRDSTTFYEHRERRHDHREMGPQCLPSTPRPTPSSRSSNSKPSRAGSGRGLQSQGFISHQESTSQSSKLDGGQAYRSERKSDGPEAPSRAGAGSARSSLYRTSANQSLQSTSSHSSRSPRYQQTRAPQSSSSRRSTN